MAYLIVGVPAFVLGFVSALVTLHVLFRERTVKPSAWRQVAERDGGAS